MFIVFCIPLSIPISIYLMWSRYFRKQYDKARLFSGIPVYVMAIVFILLGIVPYLYHALSLPTSIKFVFKHFPS